MVARARRSPRARLYSFVPRSSQCPSMSTRSLPRVFSQAALASRVLASWGRMSDLSKSKYTSFRFAFSSNWVGLAAGAGVGDGTTVGGGVGAGVGVPDGAVGGGAEAPMVTGRFGHPVSSNAMASIRIMAGADLAVVRTVSPPRKEFVFDPPGCPDA